jgi:hypothetical protein
MVDITLVDGSKLTATDNHPIWAATTGKFTDAINLRLARSFSAATAISLSLPGG